MIKMNWVCVLSIVGCMSCAEQSRQKPQATAEKPANFFPVTRYLRGQIAGIGRDGINPISITITGEKTDSSWLKMENLPDIFADFLNPEIDTTNLVPFFKEESFADETIHTYTFNYLPKTILPDTMALLRWDVLVDPETDHVKRIFIVKRTGAGKELQLTWQGDQWAKKVEIGTDKTGKQFVVSEQTIKWHFD